MSKKQSVLLVCLGNICRSPMAEAVLREQLKESGQLESWKIDSAGTGNYHIGSEPDPRTLKTLKRHNITDYKHYARQICSRDFKDFDYILVMDDENLDDVSSIANGNEKVKVKLLGSYDKAAASDQVQDPYYGRGDEGFERVFNQCWKCCKEFLKTASNGPSASESAF